MWCYSRPIVCSEHVNAAKVKLTVIAMCGQYSFITFLFFVLTLGTQSFVKVWARTPMPWMESVSLSCYSFTPESIIKQPFNLNA